MGCGGRCRESRRHGARSEELGLGNGANEVSRSTVRFDPDGTIEVRHCWTEMGQGIHTVARQVAVEELGVEPDRIKVVVGYPRARCRSDHRQPRPVMGAGSVADACQRDGGRLRGGRRVRRCLCRRLDQLDQRQPREPGDPLDLRLCRQLVELDSETGEIAKVVAAHDVGRRSIRCSARARSRAPCTWGSATRSPRAFPATSMASRSARRCAHSTSSPEGHAADEVILIQSPANSPYGIKGVGEIGLVPRQRLRQLHAHDDEWRHELPMRTERNRERRALGPERPARRHERSRASTSRLRSAMIRS